MALQMEQQQVRDLVVRVPRVARLHRLVTAIGELAAQEAVVLDVVRLRQAEPAGEMVHDEKRDHLPAEEHNADDGDGQRDRVALQNFVLKRPEAFALLPRLYWRKSFRNLLARRHPAEEKAYRRRIQRERVEIL